MQKQKCIPIIIYTYKYLRLIIQGIDKEMGKIEDFIFCLKLRKWYSTL